MNGNRMVHTVRVIVTEDKKFRMATPAFSVAKYSVLVKSLNSVRIELIFHEMDVLCMKEFFKEHRGILHMTETIKQSPKLEIHRSQIGGAQRPRKKKIA